MTFLFLRRSGFLSRKNPVENWVRLQSRYATDIQLYSIVLASFSELAGHTGLEKSIVNSIQSWLLEKENVCKISYWDIESHVNVILRNLGKSFKDSSKERFFLDLLEAHFYFPSKFYDSPMHEDEDERGKERFCDAIKEQIVEEYGEGCIGLLISILNIEPEPDDIYLSKFVKDAPDFDYQRYHNNCVDDILYFYNNWYGKFAEKTEYHTISLDSRCKILSMAILAQKSNNTFELKRFLNHNSPIVRFSLIRNKNCTHDILKSLAKDNAEFIRFFLARKETTPISILELLAKDKSAHVRAMVAVNRTSSESILNQLKADSNEIVKMLIPK